MIVSPGMQGVVYRRQERWMGDFPSDAEVATSPFVIKDAVHRASHVVFLLNLSHAQDSMRAICSLLACKHVALHCVPASSY